MGARKDAGTVVEPGSGQALERTRLALEAAERAELALAEAKADKGGGRLRKLVLLLVLGAVAALVVRKLTAKDGAGSAPEPVQTSAPSAASGGSAGEVTSSAAPSAGPAAARNGDQPEPQPGDIAPTAAASEAGSEDPAS